MIGNKTAYANKTSEVACQTFKKEEENINANFNRSLSNSAKCSDKHAHLTVHSNENLDSCIHEQSNCMESISLKCSSDIK